MPTCAHDQRCRAIPLGWTRTLLLEANEATVGTYSVTLPSQSQAVACIVSAPTRPVELRLQTSCDHKRRFAIRQPFSSKQALLRTSRCSSTYNSSGSARPCLCSPTIARAGPRMRSEPAVCRSMIHTSEVTLLLSLRVYCGRY